MKNLAVSCLSLVLLAGCSNDSGIAQADIGGATNAGSSSETDVTDRQINAANAQAILRRVASIVNEDPIEAFMRTWHGPFGGDGHWVNFQESESEQVLQVVDRGDLAEPVALNFVDYWEESVTSVATEFIDYACVNGGHIRQLIVPYIVNVHTLDDCATLSGTHSGEALRMVSHHRPFIAIGHYKNLKLVDSQQIESTLSGRFRDGGNQSYVGEIYTPTWIDVEFTSFQDNAPFELSSFNIAREESYSNSVNPADSFFQASVKAHFNVTASWSQQAELSVVVDLSLRDDEGMPASFDWQVGSVTITAPDESFMTIIVDSAEPLQFYISLENEESIGPYSWSDGFQFKLSRHWE